MRTLAIDIGGTGIKAIVLDEKGKALTDRARAATPRQASPKAVLGIIRKLAKAQDKFDRVSVGFPGVIKDGVVYSAPNLGKGWNGVNLERELKGRLDRPVRIANDADVQGLGCVRGRGVELVITLGTGFGSVLFSNGNRIHLELAHHPFHKGKTYEDELGHRALAKKGKRKWNKLLREAITDLKQTFNYDRLYIGGGNSKFVSLKLPSDVTLVGNMEGLLGGIGLWRSQTGVRRASRSRVKPQPAMTKVRAARKTPIPTAPQASPPPAAKLATSTAPSVKLAAQPVKAVVATPVRRPAVDDAPLIPVASGVAASGASAGKVHGPSADVKTVALAPKPGGRAAGV